MTDTTTPTTKRIDLTTINPLLHSNAADTFDATADALAAITEFFADGVKDFHSDRVCFGMAHLLDVVQAALRFSAEHGTFLADGGGLDVPIVDPEGEALMAQRDADHEAADDRYHDAVEAVRRRRHAEAHPPPPKPDPETEARINQRVEAAAVAALVAEGLSEDVARATLDKRVSVGFVARMAAQAMAERREVAA